MPIYNFRNGTIMEHKGQYDEIRPNRQFNSEFIYLILPNSSLGQVSDEYALQPSPSKSSLHAKAGNSTAKLQSTSHDSYETELFN